MGKAVFWAKPVVNIVSTQYKAKNGDRQQFYLWHFAQEAQNGPQKEDETFIL